MQKKKLKSLIISSLIISSFAFSNNAYSEERKDLSELSLEDILEMSLTVASGDGMSLRESPGIISVITEEEIQKSGARDLMEALQFVPSLVFTGEIQSNIGFGLRGINTVEGKALLLVDGQEMTDTLWGANIFGNRYPVSNIKRIEILRGPGSSVYGGQAELAVINVITKSAKELNGISVKAIGGMLSSGFNDFTRRTLDFNFGKQFGDLDVTGNVFWGKGNRSNRPYNDLNGKSFNTNGGTSEANPTFMNFGLQYKDLSARFIGDLYNQTFRDGYGAILDKSLKMYHNSYYGELKYDWKINDKISLTPRLNYKEQLPWNVEQSQIDLIKDSNPDFIPALYEKTAKRYRANLTLNADLTDNVNLITGTDYYRDTAEARNTFNSKFGKNKDQKSISYDNFAAFAQGVYKTDFANITLGGRFENHSEYGSSFVPRTAITTFFGDFHGKLLFSKAFKVPTIENISLFKPTDPKQTKIRPEDATVMELETGYKITDNMFITANLFDININQPIVYYYDEKELDSYANFDKIGTRGIELEYKLKDTKWGFANLAYSFYGVSDNKVERATIPNVPNQLLAYPSHKVSLNSSLNVTSDFSINPSAIFYGDRYGAGSLDKDGNVVMKKYDPTIMLNLVLSHKNFLAKGLTLDLGAYNILNQTYQYILPYNSTYAPFQGPTNDFSFNLRYDFPLGDS